MRPGGDGFGPCSDKFHKWHNGGGTLHESASIDSSAVVEIGAVVYSKAVVGANVHIGSGTIIGPSVIIGHSTKIGYNVALSNCQVGELCVVHNGVCIGQDGSNQGSNNLTLKGCPLKGPFFLFEVMELKLKIRRTIYVTLLLRRII
ncbi:hypothetical protein QN277_022360 [Acacia crassicarpa]|uniref:Glucose-1-phosphate adenylyltransferase/Bifunctional protein GlmU-like C-terminal hexapeptide domain-containing protein n=1 Tax=Acacia crassicarpa TaxID=499986 RepID=A0AAE1MPI8_9FABA|nr:hypothetical protein QN277_022360 [Acacia crassicarpa]